MTVLPDLRKPFSVVFDHSKHPGKTWRDTVYALSQSEIEPLMIKEYGFDRIIIKSIEEATRV